MSSETAQGMSQYMTNIHTIAWRAVTQRATEVFELTKETLEFWSPNISGT